jgi:hypothetical protein
MSPFKSMGTSVQSIVGSRGARISGSNVGYTKFRGSEGYCLPTPFVSFPFTSPPVRHRVPSHFNWTLPSYNAALIAANRRRGRKRLTLKINDLDEPSDHNCLLVVVMVAAVFLYKKATIN